MDVVAILLRAATPGEFGSTYAAVGGCSVGLAIRAPWIADHGLHPRAGPGPRLQPGLPRPAGGARVVLCLGSRAQISFLMGSVDAPELILAAATTAAERLALVQTLLPDILFTTDRLRSCWPAWSPVRATVTVPDSW